MSAFLPPRSWQIVCKNGQTISRVPPDLEKNVEELKKLVGIFTTVRKPECLPLFLMTGSPGSGKMNSLQLTAELLGVNLITISAYDISNLGISALEAKLDVIFQSALKRAPCILAFTMLEVPLLLFIPLINFSLDNWKRQKRKRRPSRCNNCLTKNNHKP